MAARAELPERVRAAPTLHLHPGQIHASADEIGIATILGSCVAVCLWSPESGVGGMNHFLLPYEGEADNLRFGGPAMRELRRRVNTLAKGPMEAKVFGGASVLGTGPASQLGQRNVDLAIQTLEEWQFPIVSLDTGGDGARKIVFIPSTGEVWVRKLG